MDIVTLVSEFWQFRCNQICMRSDTPDKLSEFNNMFWLFFLESRRTITIPGYTDGSLQISVLSTTQRPDIQYPYYDLQLLPRTSRHVQQLRSTSGNIRSALAQSKTEKIVASAAVNILELKLTQVNSLCREFAELWDREEKVLLSPFSPMAKIILNWLNGVYVEKPEEEYACLKPLIEFDNDKRTVIAECANSLFSILTKNEQFGPSPSVAVIGRGAWVDLVTSELVTYGADCSQYDSLSINQKEDILFLLLPENAITPEIAKQLSCKALVELLPGQIHPACDRTLLNRRITVVPDVVCSCALDIVEEWWLEGIRIPDWPMALYLRLFDIWKEVELSAQQQNLSTHDAAFKLALERLQERWSQ